MADTRRYRDRAGRVWETHGDDHMARLVTYSTGDSARTFGYSSPLSHVRNALGPLVDITEETRMPNPDDTPAQGTQYIDGDGDTWRVMRNGRFRAFGPHVGNIGQGYEITEGWGDVGDLRDALTRVPDAERVPFLPPLSYAPAGAVYRDKDGDPWYRADNGDLWVTAWATRSTPGAGFPFVSVDRTWGPLTRHPEDDIPADTPQETGPDTFEDGTGDTWYRMDNGRYTMEEDRGHILFGRTMDYVRTIYGPLSTDQAEPTPQPSPAQPNPREVAYTRARTLAQDTSAANRQTATHDHVLKLAQFLHG